MVRWSITNVVQVSLALGVWTHATGDSWIERVESARLAR